VTDVALAATTAAGMVSPIWGLRRAGASVPGAPAGSAAGEWSGAGKLWEVAGLGVVGGCGVWPSG
jgi:hypothetical protein